MKKSWQQKMKDEIAKLHNEKHILIMEPNSSKAFEIKVTYEMLYKTNLEVEKSIWAGSVNCDSGFLNQIK